MAEVSSPAILPTPREGLFFDANADRLHNLFVSLGREHEWRDNPVELLEYTQSKWVGVEHGNSSEKDQFTSEQEEAAMEDLKALGLVGDVRPPAAKADQIVVVSGLLSANRRYAKFLKEILNKGEVEAAQVVFWAGQRLREPRDDKQLAEMDIRSLRDRWVEDELAKPNDGSWHGQFATETEQARLAYVESFGSAEGGRPGDQ